MSDNVQATRINHLLNEIDNIDNLSILIKKVTQLIGLRFKVSEAIVENMITAIVRSTPLYGDIATHVVSYLQQEVFENELKFSLRMVLNMFVALQKFNSKMLLRYNDLVYDYLVNYGYQQLPVTRISLNMELTKNILFMLRKDILFRRKHAWYAMCTHMDQLQLLVSQGQDSFRQVYHFYQFVLITVGSEPISIKKD